MENARKVGLNSRKQAVGGTDRGHVSSLLSITGCERFPLSPYPSL
jgi:hypothetical protein